MPRAKPWLAPYGRTCRVPGHERTLAEEHRHDLVMLNGHLRLVIMVPRRWAWMLARTDLASAVTAVVANPLVGDELLTCLRSALKRDVEVGRIDHQAFFSSNWRLAAAAPYSKEAIRGDLLRTT